jgi:hypothetical protein
MIAGDQLYRISLRRVIDVRHDSRANPQCRYLRAVRMSNVMFHRTFVRMIGILIVLNNCSPKRVTQPGFPTALSREQVKSSLQDEWMPKRASGTQQYLIEDSSTMLISNDSTHTSLLQAATMYSLSLIALADSFAFTAKADSFSTSAASSPRRSGIDKSFSQIVHGTFSNSGEMSAINGEASSSCQEGMDHTGMRVFELIQNYPKWAIKVGTKWSDTVSVTSCRGKIPLHQQIIRQYQLLELTNWKEHAVAKIQRSVSTTVTGTNYEARNHLTATGSGVGNTILYADRTTGFLRESRSHSESKFTVTTSRGIYQFTQSITTHITIQ